MMKDRYLSLRAAPKTERRLYRKRTGWVAVAVEGAECQPPGNWQLI